MKTLILVEDKNAGKLMLDTINKLYFNCKLLIESFFGISLLPKYIDTHKDYLTTYDKVLVVYDESSGNVAIRNKVEIAYTKIKQNNMDDKIDFVSIVNFEYAILTAKHIEIFAKLDTHSKIDKLREIERIHGISQLFAYTRIDEEFKQLYEAVENKAEKEVGTIDRKLVRHKVTFEAMCKLLFSESFRNYLYIGKSFGKCWDSNCCIKKNKDCNILDKVSLTSIQKKLYLIQYSRYIKIIEIIETFFRVTRNEIDVVDMDSILSKAIDSRVLEALKVHNKIQQKSNS